MNWWGLFLVVFGCAWLGGAVFDWEWFWTRGRQGVGAKRYGRGLARVLYGLLGAAAIGLGVLLFLGRTPK